MKLVVVTSRTAKHTPHSNFLINSIRKATSMSMNQTSMFLLNMASLKSSASSGAAEAEPTRTTDIRHANASTPIIVVTLNFILNPPLCSPKNKKKGLRGR